MSEENMKPGGRYWDGNYVNPCPMCNVAPTNVDDCGCFGNPECPYFGIGKEAYEESVREARSQS